MVVRISRFAWIAASALAVAACGDDSSPAPSDATPAPTTSIEDDDREEAADGAWLAVSGTVDGSAVELVPGWDVTLTLDGASVGGRAACNGYGGTVERGPDGSLELRELGWTEMACEPAVMEVEQTYLGSLAGLTSYAIEGDVLVISGPSAEWVFERRPPVADAEIVGTEWVLDTYLRGDVATNIEGMQFANLTLHPDGTMSGSTGCRRLEGEWIISGAEIVFPSLAAIDDPAAGACSAGGQEIDGLVISVLESGLTADVDGDRLTLTAPGDEGLSFVAGG